ncbi:MAG: chemotaxis protein CheW [Phycisphaerales bacterium]|nr:chemotaxis protein CheW [Phycisphaerales bacterium]
MTDPKHHDAKAPLDAMARLLDRPAQPSHIAEATKTSAQPRASRREAQRNLLIVRCGTEWFALDAADVVHVSKVTRVHPLPHRTTKAFRGLTAISGEIVPVIDLTGLLGLTRALPTVARNPRMVQVGQRHASWAFEADEVPGVYALPAAAVRPLPLTVEQTPERITCGIVTSTHGPASLIDSVRMTEAFTKAMG